MNKNGINNSLVFILKKIKQEQGANSWYCYQISSSSSLRWHYPNQVQWV
jgi:hypothetical protein